MNDTEMPPAHSQNFEEAIRVTPVTSHTYSANLRPEWCIGGVPCGGYAAAVLHRLATTHLSITHAARFKSQRLLPISLQLSFLRRTDVGPALLTVHDTKLGARTSTIHVSLAQSRRKSSSPPEDKIVGYITISPEQADQVGPTITIEDQEQLLHPLTPGSGSNGEVNLDALGATEHDGLWELYPAYPLIAAYHQLDVYTPPFPAQHGARLGTVVEQWARFRPGGNADTGPGPVSRWSNEAVMFLADIFPRALLRLASAMTLLNGNDDGSEAKPEQEAEDKFRFWYPTVTMNVDVKKSLPIEGVDWLYCRVLTKTVRSGRQDVEANIVLPNGELVATGIQVGLTVDVARNLANRL